MSCHCVPRIAHSEGRTTNIDIVQTPTVPFRRASVGQRGAQALREQARSGGGGEQRWEQTKRVSCVLCPPLCPGYSSSKATFSGP